MKRVLTAAALIPFALYIVMWSPFWALSLTVAVVSALCYWEYSNIAAGYGFGKLGFAGYAAGIWVLADFHDPLLAAVIGTVVILAFCLSTPEVAKALPRAALIVIGVLYTFGTWRFALPLREKDPYWLLFALALNWVGDVAAFYFGKNFGRHKLAPSISPGKSWEGAVASVVFTTVFGVLYLGKLLGVGPIAAGLLTAVANVAGQIGDLAESAMKRGAGVKDSGTILPGHGGLLDRVDSSLFSIPVVWFYVRYFI